MINNFYHKIKQDIIFSYFFLLFSLIPISILVGSAVSSINIIVISLSFLIYAFYSKNWQWLKSKNIKLLLILYAYLVFNSLISLDFNIGINRNFGFIQYILFFVAFNYFFLKYENFDKIFYVWLIIVVVAVLDVYLESFTGRNIMRPYFNESHVQNRVFSFFIDEPKIGGYINCFFLLLTGYFLNVYQFKSNKLKYLIILVSVFSLTAIFLTGERAIAIKSLLASLIFFTLSKKFSIKEKIASYTIIILFFGIIYSKVDYIKYRYDQMIFKNLRSITHVVEYVKKTNFKPNTVDQFNISDEEAEIFYRSIGANYFNLYISGFKVFIKYPLFGVGNKNYRIATCTKYASDEDGTVFYQLYKYNNTKKNELYNSQYVCNTHPHQIYFEFLAEHGIVGTLILLVIFFKLISQALREIDFDKDSLQLAAFVLIILSFLPFLPSGSFFSNFPATLFWINLSIMMTKSKSNNIFR